MKKSIAILTITIALFTNLKAQKNAYLVPVGGGATNAEVMTKLIGLSNTKNPKVVIIPNASKEEEIPNTITKTTSSFEKYGLTNIKGLDVKNVEEAILLIKTADIIWMPGGQQSRLIADLKVNDLHKEILKRYKQGDIVIGGTSAGASIMSDIMMNGAKKDETSGKVEAKLSVGLKLWPETIIDQHFSERKRLNRLKSAVAQNPTLLGIGIDESTAVIYSPDKKIQVLGKGTATFVTKQRGTDSLNVEVLNSGAVYTQK